MARLEELERKFEENPRRYFAPLANEYRKAGDAQRAADLCRSQLPEVPGHISGHIVLGQALYDARDFDGSRAALETALALDPENIVALRYLGDIARDTGDAAEAERWYSRTLEADPYNEAATTALQALRAAPAGERSTEETPQPTDDVAVESPEPQPATDSPAAGFEPTSYSAPAELPPAAEVEPPVGITGAPAKAGPETASAAPPEPIEIEPPAQAVPGVETTVAEPGLAEEAVPAIEEATAGAAKPIEEAIAVPTEPVEETIAPPLEPVEETIAAATEPAGAAAAAATEWAEQVPTEVPEAVESASRAAAEIESPPVEILTVTGEFAGDLSVSAAPETREPAPEDQVASEPVEERFDVAAHSPSEPETLEEAMQAEERVLESAAPFVTETMADLYLEQGYPHEALELLLQLSEQRPHDEQLRVKIEHIESVILARRDAAVAAARAERAEAAEAAAGIEVPEDAVEAVESVEPPDAPFDAAVAEVDSSAFVASEPEPEEPVSVREMFARMDRARPRAASSVTPRPISRRRSDFVSMPEGEATASEASDDPFAFPSPPAPVPRTSGPQQTFNPSTADSDDFDAWLRGLRGP